MLWLLLLIPVIAIAWYWYPGTSLPKGKTIDRLVVYKSKRKMEVYYGAELLKTYNIALGKNPEGHKQYEGDSRTPEGKYTINARNPHSGYHKTLGSLILMKQIKPMLKNWGNRPEGI